MQSFYQRYSRNQHSQNGEDGILEEILKRIGTKLPLNYLCEFGSGDGITDSNTAALIHTGNWQGMLIEGDPALYQAGIKYWGGRTDVLRICAMVTPNSVNDLVPARTQILSIDIDGNDYQVWKALRAEVKPAVVIIEINSSLHPTQDFISADKGTNFSAMLKLGIEKDYFLLCHTGNMVFVHRLYRNFFEELQPVLDDVEDIPAATSKYFNTAWLPAEMPRDWERQVLAPAQPAAITQPVSPAPNFPPNPGVNAGEVYAKLFTPPATAIFSDVAHKATAQELPQVTFTGIDTGRIALGPLPVIGILVTATWKFTDFLPVLFESLVNFLPGYEKKVFLFTDSEQNIAEVWELPDIAIEQIKIPLEYYPEVTLGRYARYTKYKDHYQGVDYLFHLDADMKVVSVGPEFLHPLVAVQHPLFIAGGGSFEQKINSTAHIGQNTDKMTYVCGGVQGGKKENYLQACMLLQYNIEHDRINGVSSDWHDESHWNWYCSRFAQMVTILPADYCYPEEMKLDPKFQQRIIAIQKDHSQYRVNYQP